MSLAGEIPISVELLDVATQSPGIDQESTATGVDSVDRAVLELYGQFGLRLLDMVSLEYPHICLEDRIRKVGEHFVKTQTDFFREPNISSIASAIMPVLLKDNPDQEISILELGCATGKESYSLAAQILSHGYRNFQVFALDVNPDCLADAKLAEYEVSHTFAELVMSERRFPGRLIQDGYFEDTGQTWQLPTRRSPLAVIRPSDEVKEHIAFIQHDILEKPFGSDFDIAVVNNVLMHYPDRGRDCIMRNIVKSTRPGAYIAIERKIMPLSLTEYAWLRPYNRWRHTMGDRFGLISDQVTTTLNEQVTFFRTP